MAKLKDIVNCDYSDRKSKQLIQEKLMELPFFAKYEDIEDVKFDQLEAAMMKLMRKFPILLSYILFNNMNEPHFYSVMIKETEQNQHVITIYAKTLREAFEKSLLYSYHYCKKRYMEG